MPPGGGLSGSEKTQIHQLGLLRHPAVTGGWLQGPAGAVTPTSCDEKR